MMQKKVTDTSLESYVLMQPHLAPLEKLMLKVYRRNYPLALSNYDLQEELGWEINSITARRNALAKKGLIEQVGLRWRKKTRRNVQVWRLKLRR